MNIKFNNVFVEDTATIAGPFVINGPFKYDDPFNDFYDIWRNTVLSRYV